jgi:hypothetical protein
MKNLVKALTILAVTLSPVTVNAQILPNPYVLEDHGVDTECSVTDTKIDFRTVLDIKFIETKNSHSNTRKNPVKVQYFYQINCTRKDTTSVWDCSGSLADLTNLKPEEDKFVETKISKKAITVIVSYAHIAIISVEPYQQLVIDNRDDQKKFTFVHLSDALYGRAENSCVTD